jgi:ADP-ribose pyrophosphatase YjhB (NUDIX family)
VPGCECKINEAPEQAAIREVLEEVGLSLNKV